VYARREVRDEPAEIWGDSKMSNLDVAARCALEYLQLSGAKTDTRLYALCEHYAESYALSSGTVYARATELKPSWLELS
jgi:hypothetical protein